MSPIQQAISGALGTIRAAAGVQVTITRGATTSQPITAGIGETTFDVEENGAIVETWVARDYLIAASDYVIGSLTTPQKGDIVNETIGATAKQFTALAPADKDVFAYSDTAETQIRLHTKETV